MVKKILLSLIGVLVFAAGAFAQAKQVRGSVVDENGAAVIGASVIVKGTTIGVSTDQQGFFVEQCSGEIRGTANLLFGVCYAGCEDPSEHADYPCS